MFLSQSGYLNNNRSPKTKETEMETLYEEGYRNKQKSNGSKKLSVPQAFENTRTPLGRRRSATATLKNGSEIILEVPEDVEEKQKIVGRRSFQDSYDSSDVDDIQLGGEAYNSGAGGLEIPSWFTPGPRGSLSGGQGSSLGSRCGSTTSHGSTSSAISWTALQALRRTAAAASQAASLTSPNNYDPNSIASLSRVGSGCFTNDLYSAAMSLGTQSFAR